MVPRGRFASNDKDFLLTPSTLLGVMYALLGRGLAWLRLRLGLLGVGVACLHRCFASAWFGVGLASDQLRQNLLISRWVVPSTSPGRGAASKGSR